MATFLTSPTICETGTVNFFTSGNYTQGSFSQNWATKTTPDTEGLTTPVYLAVLSKFNIPVDSSNGLPPGGFLPGIDIKSMDAIQAIRFSMAEALTVGEWWEIFEDENGGVKFQKVFDDGSPGKTVTLDISLCIPSTSKSNEVDMVIVRGYKPPPQVFARDFSLFPDVIPLGSGPVNPANITGEEKVFTIDMAAMVGSCHQTELRKQAVKSYRDPMFVNEYGTQITNPFYDVKAFENIITWAIKVSGMPTAPEDAARVKYSFDETTTWYYRPTFPFFNKIVEPNESNFGCIEGLQGIGTVTFYQGSFTYESANFTDKYGFQYPLVIQPVGIFYSGYKVENVVIIGGGPSTPTFVFVNPIKEFNQLSNGSQWTYTLPAINQFKFNVFYQPKLEIPVWDLVLSALQTGAEGEVILKVADSVLNEDTAGGLPAASPGLGILPGTNSLGYYVTDFWLALKVDRPSVTVTTVEGDARTYSDSLRIQYAPIISYDPPAPIAYKHKDFGTVQLGVEEQAESLADSDPTTCQNFETTPVQIMQDRTTGNTVDVSLPFCETTQVCARVAAAIFDYQNYTDTQTFTLTCGPDDEPEIGAAVAGYDTSLRIESINYSYSDGSAYTIEVTLGPVFSNIGSWNDGGWIRKRENVQREGIITFTAGDGVNYRVFVQGLGEFNAINYARDVWRPGERVQVTVYNVPVEE